MTNVATFECKKAFRQSADTGITFHWLKIAFGDCLEGAVKEAIRVVYYPSAVAFLMDGTDRNRVIDSLNQSRRTFDRWMYFAQEISPIAKESPNRVLVEFTLTADESEAGVTLDWLLAEGGGVEKKILDAVVLLYFPVALWAFHDPDRRSAIMRSLTMFYNCMDLPGYPSPIDNFEFIKSSRYLVMQQGSAVEMPPPDSSLAVKDVPSEKIATPDEVEKPEYIPEIDMDYDF